MITNTSNILLWQSKGFSNENFDPPNTNFCPLIYYVAKKIRVKFNVSCLKQSNKISYTHKKIVHIYIVYEMNKKDNTIIRDPTLENCSFGAVTLTKKTLVNMDILDMELDLIERENFHFQVVDMVKMY